MFKHLRGERSYVICPNQKMKESLLTSMLAAGIVRIYLLEKLEKAMEAKRSRLETSSTAQARFLST